MDIHQSVSEIHNVMVKNVNNLSLLTDLLSVFDRRIHSKAALPNLLFEKAARRSPKKNSDAWMAYITAVFMWHLLFVGHLRSVSGNSVQKILPLVLYTICMWFFLSERLLRRARKLFLPSFLPSCQSRRPRGP